MDEVDIHTKPVSLREIVLYNAKQYKLYGNTRHFMKRLVSNYIYYHGWNSWRKERILLRVEIKKLEAWDNIKKLFPKYSESDHEAISQLIYSNLPPHVINKVLFYISK